MIVGAPSHVQQLARRTMRVLANIESLVDLCAFDRLRVRRGRDCHWIHLDSGWHLRFEWREDRCAEVVLIDREAS